MKRFFSVAEQPVRRDLTFFGTLGVWVAANVVSRLALPENVQPNMLQSAAEVGAGILYAAVGVRPTTNRAAALGAGAAFGAFTGVVTDVALHGFPQGGGEWGYLGVEAGVGAVGGGFGTALATESAPRPVLQQRQQ